MTIWWCSVLIVLLLIWMHPILLHLIERFAWLLRLGLRLVLRIVVVLG